MCSCSRTRFFLLHIFLLSLVLGPVLRESRAQLELQIDGLRKLSQARSQPETGKQIPVFPKDKTVIEMTAKELLRYYPSELRRLEFSPNQDELNSLLKQIGDKLRSFFRDFSNTSSKESVFLQRPGGSAGVSRQFNYLISYEPSDSGPVLKEYRTDRNNRPIDQTVIKGFFVTSGYVGLSLNFHPAYQQGCRFRYLGKQTSDFRVHIIAFAQKPEAKDLQIQYIDTITGASFLVPVQGIAWVDPDSYQVLRLRINLLGPVNRSFMTEQSTDIKLGEVKFEATGKRLWLPREVVVNTLISGMVLRNQHRYTEYKLFDVTSEFKIGQPKAQTPKP